MRQEYRREPHRLPAKFGTNGGLWGRPMVAFVKEQIESPLHCGETRGELGRRGDVEKLLRFCEHFLCPRDSLRDRRVGTDERAGDLAHAEAAWDVDHKSHLRLLGPPGM